MAKVLEIKKILKLKKNNVSQNGMAKTYHIGKNTSKKVLDRAKELDVVYDDIKDKDNEYLMNLFFPERERNKTIYREPDFEKVQKELAKTGVTLKLLWQEYCDLCSLTGEQHIWYGGFCKMYHKYVGTKNVTNMLEHKPGQEIEVDWAGKTMVITDEITGAITKAYLFVATLPFSQYSYVEATLDMKQATWIKCNVNMFTYINGITRTIKCDNLKTGIISHPKEGDIVYNKAYAEFGEYYEVGIIPAGVRKPKQKASVEATVGKITTSIIAKLRDVRFTSLHQLNEAIRFELVQFNTKSFQKKYNGKYSRYDVFVSTEKDYLRPLPKLPYEYGFWIYGRKVQINSHVQYQKNYYSCPYQYIKESVDLKISDNLLRIYLNGKHLVTHELFPTTVTYKYKTRKQDLPKYFNETSWNAPRILNWASSIGSNTTRVVDAVLKSSKYTEQQYKSAISILNLSKTYGKEELEMACSIALKSLTCPRYKHIKATLNSQLFKDVTTESKQRKRKPLGIVRGADYFQNKEREVNKDDVK